MEIGRRIEYAMKEVLGLTQKELEAKTGISQSTLSRIINGQYNLNSPSGHKYLEKIATGLGDEVHVYLSDQDLLNSDIKSLEEKLLPGKKIGVFIQKHLSLTLEFVSEETGISVPTLQRITSGDMVLTDKVGRIYVAPLCELVNSYIDPPLTQEELLYVSMDDLKERTISETGYVLNGKPQHAPPILAKEKKASFPKKLIPWVLSGVLLCFLVIQSVSPIYFSPPRDEIISIKSKDKYAHTIDVYGTLSDHSLGLLKQGHHAWLVMEYYNPQTKQRCLLPKEPEISYFYSTNRWVVQIYNDPALMPDTVVHDIESQLDLSLFLLDKEGHEDMIRELSESKVNDRALHYHRMPQGIRIFRTNVM